MTNETLRKIKEVMTYTVDLQNKYLDLIEEYIHLTKLYRAQIMMYILIVASLILRDTDSTELHRVSLICIILGGIFCIKSVYLVILKIYTMRKREISEARDE